MNKEKSKKIILVKLYWSNLEKVLSKNMVSRSLSRILKVVRAKWNCFQD